MADSMGLLYLLSTFLVFHATVKCTRQESTAEQLDTAGVCFAPYGCFSSRGSFSHMVVQPQSPAAIELTFRLFTPGIEQPETFNLTRMRQNPLLNATDKLYILIHGFGGFPRWIHPMTRELLKKDITVIAVDWSKGSRPPNYYQAASNTRVVGAIVAEVVENLLNNTKFTMKDMTLVGFSLGAHVCGFAGKRLRKQKLSHIIALDPAGPLFSGQDPKARLAPTDADFVECTHTNGKKFIHGGLGTMQPMGHVDFYPNGGKTQLGCPKNVKEIILDLWSVNMSKLDTLACSHRRAPLLFTESIRTTDRDERCEFSVLKCNSSEWEKGRCFRCHLNSSLPTYGFGLTESVLPAGSFYFATRGHSDYEVPFCATGDWPPHLSTRLNLSGYQYGFVIQPDRQIKGSVRMFITYKDGKEEAVDIVSESEELDANNNKVKILALSKPIEQHSSVNLLYKRNKNIVRIGRSAEWNLKSLSILDFSCKYGASVVQAVSPTVLDDNSRYCF